jgi:hypothetical protein
MKSSLVKTNNTLLFFLVLLSQIIFGQSFGENGVRGKIIADSAVVESANIVNSSSGKAVVSNENGMFSILAKEGDVLVVSAVNLVTLRRRLNKGDLGLEIIVFQMTSKSIELKEVVVNKNSNINAQKTGFVSYGQKKYSPAERKLYTANSGLLDRPLNWISGRKAMLKKEVAIELKEQELLKLGYLLGDKYYVDNLKIPHDYIRGFQYYCIDDVDFVSALNSKNNSLSMFLIIILAEKYLKIIANEN